jgi:hemerythrin superfamily protein
MKPASRTTGSDVIDVLRADHRSVEQMLSRFESVGAEDRSEWFDQLRDVLVRHEAAEELAVYPAVGGGTSQDQILDARLAEQAEVHDLIARLETVNSGTEDFRAGCLILRRAVLDHARREERSVFGLIEVDKSREERSEMGRQYERAMHGAESHPTHPSSRLFS